MATRAYSYIRFSSPEQAKGDSLRRQLSEAQAWCAERGLELDDSLRDLGRSAFRGGHAKDGSLARFLQLVEDGKIERGSYLIVESLDRLSREEVADAASRLLALINAGITVVTLSDRQVYSRDSVRDNWTLLLLSLSSMQRAHEESALKSQRVGKAWAQKRVTAAETGQAMTSIAPAWLTLVGDPKTGHYEVNEERAAMVRKFFDDTIAGLGRRAIANALNAQKVPTWGRGRKAGSRWHDSYIQKILNNPAVFGRFEPLSARAGGTGVGSIVLDDYYPPVIDQSTYYRAQAASQSRGAGGGRVDTENSNLLRGLVRCRCGAALVRINKGKRGGGVKLTCGAAHAAAGCNDRTYYNYKVLEVGVLWSIGNRRAELIAGADSKVSALKADRAMLTARRDDAARRLLNLIELVQATGGAAAVAKQVVRLQAEVDEVEPMLRRIDADISAAVDAPSAAGDDLLAVYRTLSTSNEGDTARRDRAFATQRIRELVHRIEIEPGRARILMAGGGEGFVEGQF